MVRLHAGSVVAVLGGAVIAGMILLLVAGVLIRPDLPTFAPTPAAPWEVGSALVGPETVTVDARDPLRWVYFDFSRGSVVPVDDRSSLDWDLAFNRFRIVTNGGATNPRARGAVVDLGAVPLDSVIVARDTGYVEDVRASGAEVRNPALERWYQYSWLTHRLKPNAHVHVVRTADGRYAKIEILSYYCEGGQPGCMTFRYVYAGDGGRRFAPD